MSNVDNLAKFEWENEIPFPVAQVKKSIHAMIGEETPNKVLGLLMYNPEKMKWDLNCVGPVINEAFGSYSFGQVNSSISITVKEVSEKTTYLKITVSARRGGMYGNQSYLQGECDRFNKALGYYLKHEDQIDRWHNEFKPSQISENASSNSGCMVIVPLIVGGGMLAWQLLC